MVSTGYGASATWITNQDGNWSDTSKWSTTPIPGTVSSDVATFNTTGSNGNESIYLNGDRTLADIAVLNTGTTSFLGGDYNAGSPISGTSKLTILSSGGGITMNATPGAVVVGSSDSPVNITLGGPSANTSTYFNSGGSGGTLIVNGSITAGANTGANTSTLYIRGTTGAHIYNGVLQDSTGGGRLALNFDGTLGATGTYYFNRGNTFTGGATFGSGGTTVAIGANNALGTGAIAISNGGVGNVIFATGKYSIPNNITNSNANPTITGTHSLSLTGTYAPQGGGRTLTNNIANGFLSIGTVGVLEAQSRSLTLAGSGNTNIGGVVNGSGTTTLIVTNTGVTTIGGSNNFTGGLKIDTGSTVKLTNANAVANSLISLNGASSGRTTTWLANDGAINNLRVDFSAPNGAQNQRLFFDAASLNGYSGDQTISGFHFGQQQNVSLFKGGLASGNPAVTITSGTFGNNASGKNSIINPMGVNLTFGNITAAGGGTIGIASSLTLEGNTTANKVTGAISNGSSGTILTSATVVSVSGNVLTMAGAPTGYVAGMRIAGVGVDGAVITAVSGNNITLSQTPTASAGTILTGSVAHVAWLYKAGIGTWTLSTPNTYTGQTSVQGGTLKLDFSGSNAPASDILYNDYGTVNSGSVRPTVNLGTGTLEIVGKAGAVSTQNVGTVSLNAGGYSTIVKLTPGTGGTAALNLFAFTQNTNAMITDFRDGTGTALSGSLGAAQINVSNGAANSFIGWHATVNKWTDFARYDASKFITTPTASNYTTFTPSIATGTNTTYYTGTGNITRSTAGSDFTYQGLKLVSDGNDQVLNLNGGSLSARATNRSSILYAGGGNGNYTISSGTIKPGSAASALTQFIQAENTTLTIDSTTDLADNGVGAHSIMFGGASSSKAVVVGAKSFTGKLFIEDSTYSFDTLANGNVASGLGKSTNASANIVINGGTLRYTGGTASTDRGFQINGSGATIDASGTGAITWAPAANLAWGEATNGVSGAAAHNEFLTLTGTNTGDNIFGGGAGVIGDNTAQGYLFVTKTGVGKWTISGSNSYSGPTTIAQGTLGVSNVNSLGSTGYITFTGGSLQYVGVAPDFSARIKHSTSVVSIDTNSQSVTFGSNLDSSNSAGLTKSGPGTLTLTAENTFTGATSVTGGTLAANKYNALGATSSVTVSDGAALTLGVGAAGGEFINDLANIILLGNTSTFTLNYIGTETIAGLTANGNAFAAGLYSSTDLNNAFGGSQFSGTGLLLVVPEPGSAAFLVAGLGMLAIRRRSRRS